MMKVIRGNGAREWGAVCKWERGGWCWKGREIKGRQAKLFDLDGFTESQSPSIGVADEEALF
jgi:hypothetical protein